MTRVGLVALLPLVFSLGACRFERNPLPEVLNVDSAARADIRSTMAAYRSALLENDAGAIVAFFTPDAHLLEPGEPDLVGTSAIESAMADFFEAGGAITAVEVEPAEIHVDGAVAFEFGTFRERYRTADAAENTVHGRYVVRWRRGPEARWQIERFLLNHYPPDSVAGPP